jgi:hypothetical protein
LQADQEEHDAEMVKVPAAEFSRRAFAALDARDKRGT